MTLGITAHQVPLSKEFPRQEYWSGLPVPSPGGLPIPGTEAASHVLAGGPFIPEPPGKPPNIQYFEYRLLVTTDACRSGVSGAGATGLFA